MSWEEWVLFHKDGILAGELAVLIAICIGGLVWLVKNLES